MGEFPYLDYLSRSYIQKANRTRQWTDYLKAHGLANASIAIGYTNETKVLERQQLVYEIERSWYKDDHPLTFSEHSELTAKHKQLLNDYRAETLADFTKLDHVHNELDMSDIFSEANMQCLSSLSGEIFAQSKKCSDGYVEILRHLVQSSVEILAKLGKTPPCRFAVIALGSIAKGVATPYSDVEYAIIVESSRDIEYFMMLAVDTYFRIGNFCETPMQSLGISELNTQDKPLLVITPNVGIRIDGSDRAGNIPTGPEDGQRLILTVSEFLDLYRTSACSAAADVLWDISHLLSTSTLIYSNESGDSSLHQRFIDSIREYETNHARYNEYVSKKRLRVLLSDIERYDFLPEFKTFDPPDNFQIDVKLHIYRYPTLLAHNFKLCLTLDPQYPWEIFSQLLDQGLLTPKIHQYLRIALALSIYIRTRAHLQQQTQSKLVTLYSRNSKTGIDGYHIPMKLFKVLGCLLVPIKESVAKNVYHQIDGMTEKVNMTDVMKNIIKGMAANERDFMLKAELSFLGHDYEEALKEISNGVGKNITAISAFDFIEAIRKEYSLTKSDPQERKYLQLCSYLLYRCRIYTSAIEYLTGLATYAPTRVELACWKIATAHSLTKIHRHKSSLSTLQQVLNILTDVLGIDKPSKLLEHVQDKVASKTEFSEKLLSIYNMVAEMYRLMGNAHIGCLQFSDGVHWLKVSVSIFEHLAKPVSHAIALQSLAKATQEKGMYRETLDYLRQALDLLEDLPRDQCESRSIAECYGKIGAVQSALQLYEDSSKSLKKALDIVQKDDMSEFYQYEVAVAHFNLSKLQGLLGDYRELHRSSNIALNYMTEVLGGKKIPLEEKEDSNEVGKKLQQYNIPLVYEDQSFELKRPFTRTNPLHLDMAAAYKNMGNIYASAGKYDLALEYYFGSLKVETLSHGPRSNSTEIANTYNNVGLAYTGLGKDKFAFEYHTKSLHILKALQTESSGSIDIARTYSYLGKTHIATGNLRTALDYHTESLNMQLYVYGADCNHPSIAYNYNSIGQVHQLLGNYNLALESFGKSLHMAKAVYGCDSNHPDIAIVYNNLGTTYHSLKEFKLALQHHMMSLDMLKSKYGVNWQHSFIADSYTNIARDHQSLEDFKAALFFYMESLNMKRAVYHHTPDHPDIATTYNSIGNTYRINGNCPLALEYHIKSLDMLKAVHGADSDHSSVASSYNSIGLDHMSSKNYTLALEHFTKSLNMLKAVHGCDSSHPHIADAYRNIGDVHYSQGDFSQSLEYHIRSLEVLKALYHPDSNHSSIASGYSSIGLDYESLQIYQLALTYLNLSLDMLTAVHGSNSNHPDIADAYSNVGNVHYSRGDFSESLKYHTKSLEVLKAVHGADSDHPSIASSYNIIGIDYLSMGQNTEALEYFIKSLEMTKAIHGNDITSSDIGRAYDHIGNIYHRMGNYAIALEYHIKSLEMLKAVYGTDSNHSSIASSYNSIGLCYTSMGNSTLALEYFIKSLEMKKAIFGDPVNRPDIAIMYNNIGNTYRNMGDYAIALKYHINSLEMLKAVYGADTNHPLLANSYNSIGNTYYKNGDYASALEFYTKSLDMLKAAIP